MFEVDFVFDQHGKLGKKARDWWYEFKDKVADDIGQWLGEEPVFRDEKKVVALQAADMVAWFTRREAVTGFSKPDQQRICQSLKEYQSTVELHAEGLENMAIDLGVAKPFISPSKRRPLKCRP